MSQSSCHHKPELISRLVTYFDVDISHWVNIVLIFYGFFDQDTIYKGIPQGVRVSLCNITLAPLCFSTSCGRQQIFYLILLIKIKELSYCSPIYGPHPKIGQRCPSSCRCFDFCVCVLYLISRLARIKKTQHKFSARGPPQIINGPSLTKLPIILQPQ